MVRGKALGQRIRLEINELEHTVSTIRRHWQRAKNDREDSDAFLNSVALNLHSFYNGLERTLEIIAVEIDGGALGGESWHTELLRQMAMDVPTVRPAVLSPASARQLDEYRKFRHRVRNIYATHLAAPRMAHLIDDLAPTWAQVRSDLLAFTQFLEQLS